MPEDLEWIRREAMLREETLAAAFKSFSANWSLSDKGDCFMNRGLLLVACEAYFRDIYRRKDFHGIHVADSHKRAGYSAKWLMRFRPIQHQSNHISEKVSLANEFFAFWVACEHLSVDVADMPIGVIEHVLYHLRFRPFDSDAWAFSFFLLERCAQHGVLSAIGHPHPGQDH